MTPNTLLWPILLPAVVGRWSLLAILPARVKWLREALGLRFASIVLVYLAFALFAVKNLDLARCRGWVRAIGFELRLIHFSAFILLGLAGFLFLITLYSAVKMKDHPRIREYYAYVFLSAALANGAVLADNFVLLRLLLGRAAGHAVRPDHDRRQGRQPDRDQGLHHRRAVRLLHDPGHRHPLGADRAR